MKKFARWVYDWITILAASLVGIPSILLEFLHHIEFVDFSPWVGAERSLQIVTGVAVVKAILALIESRMKVED